MPAKFKAHACHDILPPLSTENAFLSFGAFAGIRTFNFDSKYSVDNTGWTVDATASITADTTQITVTAPSTPASTWFKAIQGVVVPHSHTLTFKVSAWGWGAIIGWRSTGEHWLLTCSATGKIQVLKWLAGATDYVIVFSRSAETSVPVVAEILIAFREISFGEASGGEIYHNISLYANNKHISTYTERADAGLITADIHFGLTAKTNTAIAYSSVRVPELSNVLDWLSIDPGEAAIGGLGRAIDGQHIKFFMRFDGTLRAWKPKLVTAAQTYTDIEDVTQKNITIDARGLKTHVRLTGGYTQAECARPDLIAKYGHRFAEVSNPYILTVSECFEEAGLTIKRMEEQLETETFSASYSPLLEPEDRIETTAANRIVTSRSVQADGARMVDSISSRTYVYGA